MGGLRTLLLTCVCFCPAAVLAIPSSPDERALLFADCAGSFAAEAEHRRLMRHPDLDQAEDTAALFSLLLEATLTEAMQEGAFAQRLRATRAEARLIQRDLLTSATFAVHESHRAPARHAAQRRRATCETLLLGS